MSNIFKLQKQLPKSKNIGRGYLSIDRKGEACFFSENGNLITLMIRVRIELAAAHGIMLSGFEEEGIKKYRYQEWWLVYT